jgi:hypothetical protein
LKGEFEKNKKQLELMIKEIRDNNEEQAKRGGVIGNAHNTSVTSGSAAIIGSNEKSNMRSAGNND